MRGTVEVASRFDSLMQRIYTCYCTMTRKKCNLRYTIFTLKIRFLRISESIAFQVKALFDYCDILKMGNTPDCGTRNASVVR
jgi:hypothetical protein